MGKRQRDALLKKMCGYNKGSGGGGSSGNNNGGPRQPQPRAEKGGPAASSGATSMGASTGSTFQGPSALRGDAAPAAAPRRPGGTVVSAAAVDATITDEQLRGAIDVLTALHDHPELFRAPRYKGLRAAVYPLVQPANAAGLVSRVSDAVADGRWADAMLALHAMKVTGEMPKLGSVQRWVRDCDLAGADGDPGLLCLDAILRTAAPEQICPVPSAGFDEATSPILLREPAWEHTPLLPAPPKGLDDEAVKAVAKKFRVLMREPASARRPANLHEMILYTCPNDAVPMRPADQVDVEKIDVPFVPASCCLAHVLSPDEATSIIQVGETVGFTPDVPLTGKKSILAHHFVWMADEAWITNVFERCRKHLPAEIHGAKIVGLNRRLRCYRYVKGSVYRPHVDGAWPMSGIDAKTGEYIYDAAKGKVSSKLTFLLYLNEGFEGGCTTYFTPAMEPGHLRVTPVAPRVGSVMVFPHADTAGCLVHEGSGVESGTKYIIRTEVLYEL